MKPLTATIILSVCYLLLSLTISYILYFFQFKCNWFPSFTKCYQKAPAIEKVKKICAWVVLFIGLSTESYLFGQELGQCVKAKSDKKQQQRIKRVNLILVE
ncbi:Hypothetical_protein [Hexamita inflata]|uniref:Hypothetical_protein n=1 Tax=Hexamita inflata TaxID=28002 RepID=A0AA86R265_9EUKA|nr:Hypothetical protein HINF_LOCUS52492 [Hexamita inflata]